MARIVQKFGGTSVGDLDRIKKLAERALKSHREGHQVVLVVSAMSGETNRLVDLAKAINPIPFSAEYDMLLASGERISLCARRPRDQYFGAGSLRIFSRKPSEDPNGQFVFEGTHPIDRNSAARGEPQGRKNSGHRGISGVDAQGKITTLGRGGSDTTAVAIAIALGADQCDIFTDVDGVYTADPRVPKARKIDRITYDEMLEMAHLGAKVIPDPLRGVSRQIQNADPSFIQLQRWGRNTCAIP